MADAKRLMIYSEKLVQPNQEGICDCGHVFHTDERFMAYPLDEPGMFIMVCLSCHFWNVLEDDAK